MWKIYFYSYKLCIFFSNIDAWGSKYLSYLTELQGTLSFSPSLLSEPFSSISSQNLMAKPLIVAEAKLVSLKDILLSL